MIEDRFWAKVKRAGPDDCWLWLGAPNSTGYGVIRADNDGPLLMASHVALRIAGRPLRDGEKALHTCDTPLCVNERHLYAGDDRQNLKDCRQRLRRGKLHLLPRAFELFAAGRTMRAVANELGVCILTAANWRRAWKRDPKLERPLPYGKLYRDREATR